MTATLAIARVTYRQLLGRKRLIGLGLFALFPAFVFFLSSGASTGSGAINLYVEIMVGTLFAIVTPVITLIIAGAALGDERSGETVPFLVMRPIPRPLIAAAKLLTAWLSSFTIVGVGALVMAATLGVRSSEWSLIVPTMAGIFIATGMYTALFVPFGFLAERATLIGLIYVFVWELAIATAIGSFATLSPWRTGLAGFAGLVPLRINRFVPDEFLGNLLPGFGGSFTKMAVLILISVAATTLLLRRRDLV